MLVQLHRVATTNALPQDDEGNDVRYESNLERLHAQADEEFAFFNDIGLADLLEEQRASHGALVSRLNDMYIKYLETTWVPNTLRMLADEKKKIGFEHAKLGMPPAHEEEALPPVREAIVKTVEGTFDRGVPSLLKDYSASILLPMKRDIRRVVEQAMMDASAPKTVLTTDGLTTLDIKLSAAAGPSARVSESRGGKQVELQLCIALRDGFGPGLPARRRQERDGYSHQGTQGRLGIRGYRVELPVITDRSRRSPRGPVVRAR